MGERKKSSGERFSVHRVMEVWESRFLDVQGGMG